MGSLNFKKLFEITVEISRIESDVFLTEREKKHKLEQLKEELDKMKKPKSKPKPTLFFYNSSFCLN